MKTASLSGLAGGFAALMAACAGAAPQYVASTIALTDEAGDHRVADMNGDGRNDIVVANWSENRGRELLIYWQSESGKFGDAPDRRIEIKTEIVAVGLADLREVPGVELLLITRTAVYSLSTAQESYSNNLQKLFDWDFIATVPEPRRIAFIGGIVDLSGDGQMELLLPGAEQFALFSGNREGYQQNTQLPAPYSKPGGGTLNGNVGFAADNRGFRLTINNPTPFDNLVVDRLAADPDENRRDTPRDVVLDVKHWLFAVQPGNINGDKRLDLIYLDDTRNENNRNRRFNVLQQSANGKFPDSPSWQGEIAARGNLLLADIDNDGRDDVLATDSDNPSTTTVYFYLNQNGKFDFATPTQVMKFSGYDVQVGLQDLNGDTFPELLVTSYDISAVSAVRNGNMVRSLLIYQGGRAGNGEGVTLFERRPRFKLDETFSASNFKGLVQRMTFDADVDGDGRPDALSLDERGALTAKRITRDLQIESTALWQFVPTHLIQALTTTQFNNDAASDFVLRHQHSLTTLVSQP